MSRFIRFLTLTLTLTCLSCAQLEKSQDKMLVKDTIISYNRMLIEAAKTGNVEPLKDILSEKESRKLYFWIASWHDSDVYMDAKLKNIKFKSLKISGQTANVLTSEDWTYEYLSLKTKQIVLPASDIHYEMEYILQRANKDDKKWVIKEINIKAERKEKSS